MKRFLLFLLPLLQSFNSLADDSSLYRFCFERWWPHSFLDQYGNAQGIEIELLKAVSEEHNLTIEFSELPYQRCLDSVKNGTIDFALHIDKADDLLMLDNSYTSWSLSFAVKQGRFASIADFIGSAPSVMMAVEYTYPDEIYQKLKKMNAIIVERSFYEQTDEDAKHFFSVLNNERIDAVLVDRRWATKMINNYQIPVVVLPEVLHEEPQFMGYMEYNRFKAAKLTKMLNSLPSSVKAQIELKFQSK